LGDQLLEAQGIELVVANVEYVAGRAALESLGLRRRQDLAQPGDLHLQGLTGVRGRVISPELVDEAVGRNHLVGRDQ
jgi:hypothetical protein